MPILASCIIGPSISPRRTRAGHQHQHQSQQIHPPRRASLQTRSPLNAQPANPRPDLLLRCRPPAQSETRPCVLDPPQRKPARSRDAPDHHNTTTAPPPQLRSYTRPSHHKHLHTPPWLNSSAPRFLARRLRLPVGAALPHTATAATTNCAKDTLICSQWAWVPLASYGAFNPASDLVCTLIGPQFGQGPAHQPGSRHQEDHEALQHSGPVQAHLPRTQAPQASPPRKCAQSIPNHSGANSNAGQIISLSDIFISPLEDMYACHTTPDSIHANSPSYFVTELLGTDLHRLLTSRPLEKQFIQYFLYQILVRGKITQLENYG